MGSVFTLSLARPTLRRRAPLVLGVWLLAWFVLALQPCCEAVAALAEAPAQHSRADHQPLADVPDEHGQCVAEGPAQSAPAVVGGGAPSDGQALDKPVSPLPGLVTRLTGRAGPGSAISSGSRRPAGNQQYLLTARLRI